MPSSFDEGSPTAGKVRDVDLASNDRPHRLAENSQPRGEGSTIAGIGCRAGEGPDMSDGRKSGARGEVVHAASRAGRRQVAPANDQIAGSERLEGAVDVPAYHATDGRRMCFGQGKPLVYMADEDASVVITEWPNGVVDEFQIEDESMIRSWPDGTKERLSASDAKTPTFPHL